MHACRLLITPRRTSDRCLQLNEEKKRITQRRLPHNHKKASASSSYGHATVALKNSTSGSSTNLSSPSNTLTHTHKTHAYVHSFGQPTLTPWKVPTPLTTITWYESPLPLALLLQGETFPRRGKKHLVVISLPFFTPLFPSPLHSISKNKNKQWLENRCIASHGPALPLMLVRNPKNKTSVTGWRHRCTTPYTTPSVPKHRLPMC